MTDIISETTISDAEAAALVELMFFAYRDFVADPDDILDGLGFGRAHHRVLHFVGRSPGMTVAQLLDILRITKQSLSRVLKELLEKQYVLQREGADDRRQRLLYLTTTGEALWHRLIAPQKKRFRRSVSEMPSGNSNDISEILLSLINPENREVAQHWIDQATHSLRAGKTS